MTTFTSTAAMVLPHGRFTTRCPRPAPVRSAGRKDRSPAKQKQTPLQKPPRMRPSGSCRTKRKAWWMLLLPRRGRSLRTSPLHTMKLPSRTALMPRPVRWAATRPLLFLQIAATTTKCRTMNGRSRSALTKSTAKPSSASRVMPSLRFLSGTPFGSAISRLADTTGTKSSAKQMAPIRSSTTATMRAVRTICSTPSATRANSSLWKAVLPAGTTAIGRM